MPPGGDGPAPRAHSRFAALASSGEEEDNENGHTPDRVQIGRIESPGADAPSASGAQGVAAESSDAGDWSVATSARGTKAPARGARPDAEARRFPRPPQKHAPLAVEQLCPARTLEVLDFPAAWRTADIRRFVDAAGAGPYRIKWQDDTSCFVHFDAPEAAAAALAFFRAAAVQHAHVRVFAPENVRAPRADAPEASSS